MKIGIGQDSHRFDPHGKKPLILGGVLTDAPLSFEANSDGDVVLHALANAVSGVTGVNILGEAADKMCADGITDSAAYVKAAIGHLTGGIAHVSFSIECAAPKITPLIPKMRASVANLLQIPESAVGITATSGEGLTAFGRGEGVQVFCIVTAE